MFSGRKVKLMVQERQADNGPLGLIWSSQITWLRAVSVSMTVNSGLEGP